MHFLIAFESSCIRVSPPSHNNALASTQINNTKSKLSAFVSSCLRVPTPSHNNALASTQINNTKPKLSAFVSSCLRVSNSSLHCAFVFQKFSCFKPLRVYATTPGNSLGLNLLTSPAICLI
jgi:hypothetical protein